MIVRETSYHHICITQHDHGLLSGQMAFHSHDPFPTPTQQMIVTASLHDSSWVRLDNHMPWNTKKDRPYDFIDLPLAMRLSMYHDGLTAMEDTDPYTALLSSIHYETFLQHDDRSPAKTFIDDEHKRQQRLKKRDTSLQSLSFSLRALQMWDHLSLFVCLHQPGSTADQTHSFYRNGIPSITQDDEPVSIQGTWLNKETLSLDPFPFKEPWTAKIPYYQCRKSLGQHDPDKDKRRYYFVTFVPAD